jgi:hypothetical protein
MKRKPLIRYMAILVVVLLLVGLLVAIQAYRGTYLGEQQSPCGRFSLRYYESFNPFKMKWSMPGDAACTPEWIRLYSKNGEKLNELYTTSCETEVEPHWLNDELNLSDGVTIWKLPERSSMNERDQ